MILFFRCLMHSAVTNVLLVSVLVPRMQMPCLAGMNMYVTTS